MAANLLDTLEGFLTPAMIQQASTFLDERPSSTQKAIEGAVPALLGGLIERSSTPAGAETLLTVINRVGQRVDLAELARGTGSLDDLIRSGKEVLGTIVGGKLGTVVEQVASVGGLRQTSATSLLAMLGPIVLGVLGREVSLNGLNAAGLVSLLAGQRADVTRFLPAGLSGLFAGVTGLVKEDPALVAALAAQASGTAAVTAATTPAVATGAASDLADTVARRTATFADTMASVGRAGDPSATPALGPESSSSSEPSRGRRWTLPVIVLALLAFVLWWLLRDPPQDEHLAQAAEPTAGSPAPSSAAAPSAGSPSAAAPSPTPSSPTPSSPATPAGASTASEGGSAATPAGAGEKAAEAGKAVGDAAAGAAATGVDAAAGMAPAGMASIALPGGTKLDVPQGSATYDLARYLAAGSATDVPRAFVFERLQFRSGSTRLTRTSRETVDHLAAILKAYPSAAVRLAGYTDSRGQEAWNKALSAKRAEAVKSLIEGQGIAADRLSAAGLGEDTPIASNATSSGRQKNRRIEVVVTQR